MKMKINEKHAWKKRIALDIDGTLWDFYGPFFEFYNDKYGTDYELEDFNCDLSTVLSATQDQLNGDFKEFEKSSYCEDLALYENVGEILFELSQKYFFILITAKDSSHRDIVSERLKRKLPKFDFPIYFSGDFVGATGGKDKICKDTGCEIIIEDSLHNAMSCAKSGVKSILVNRYWNQERASELGAGELEVEQKVGEIWRKNLIRVKSWKEVLGLISSW